MSRTENLTIPTDAAFVMSATQRENYEAGNVAKLTELKAFTRFGDPYLFEIGLFRCPGDCELLWEEPVNVDSIARCPNCSRRAYLVELVGWWADLVEDDERE